MKIPIDPKSISSYLKANGLTYEDVQEQSGGLIKVDHLKYVMTKSLKMDENRLRVLATLCGCELDDLVNAEFLRQREIPIDVHLMVRNLYTSSRKNFSPSYREYIRRHQKKASFQSFVVQASSLYLLLTEKTSNLEEINKMLHLRDFILKQFSENTQDILLENISSNAMTWFIGNLKSTPDEEIFVISVFVFAYTLLVLDELLHHELVASAIYLSADYTEPRN